MVGKGKVETGRSQAELDLAKENKQALASPTAKLIIWKQGNNYRAVASREVRDAEGLGIKEPKWE